MEGKRLDLDAPLLSIRRVTAQSNCEKVAPPTPLWRNLKSGLVGSPGAVPFVWETTPGQPKDSFVGIANVFLNPAVPKLPPGRSMKESGADWWKGTSAAPATDMVFPTQTSLTCSTYGRNEKAKVEDEDEVCFTECVDDDDAFTDARDAFSCADSFSMKCGVGVRDHSKSVTDPQFKDVMMGRFLPAAHAMAEGSLQRTWRKPPRPPAVYCDNSINQTVKNRLPLDQYQLSRVQLHGTAQYEEDEEEDDGDEIHAGSGIFSSNGCGLIHRLCLKNTFGIFNPDPGKKAQGKSMPRTHNRPSPHTKVLLHTSLGQTKDEDSWEAVYRYKHSQGYYPHKGEERKLYESNQLTSWSDSQMLDGSSFLNSTVSGLSSDKHEDPKRESGSWRRGSSDSCEQDNGCYWDTTSHEKLQDSDSTSSANKIHCNQNPFHFQVTPDCKSSENVYSYTKAMIESSGYRSGVETKFQQTEESVVPEVSTSKIAEPGVSSYFERLNDIKVDCNGLNKNDDGDGLALEVKKNDNSLTLSLLPPPLPTSPSESWLQRTLPYVSSKGVSSHRQSFLGIQLHPKKQVSWASVCDNEPITYEKTSNMHPRRTRFADVTKGS